MILKFGRMFIVTSVTTNYKRNFESSSEYIRYLDPYEGKVSGSSEGDRESDTDMPDDSGSGEDESDGDNDVSCSAARRSISF
jgi:hypothetical protein